jgi:hypothetical protein
MTGYGYAASSPHKTLRREFAGNASHPHAIMSSALLKYANKKVAKPTAVVIEAEAPAPAWAAASAYVWLSLCCVISWRSRNRSPVVSGEQVHY